jgi:hypothetical protein
MIHPDAAEPLRRLVDELYRQADLQLTPAQLQAMQAEALEDLYTLIWKLESDWENRP